MESEPHNNLRSSQMGHGNAKWGHCNGKFALDLPIGKLAFLFRGWLGRSRIIRLPVKLNHIHAQDHDHCHTPLTAGMRRKGCKCNRNKNTDLRIYCNCMFSFSSFPMMRWIGNTDPHVLPLWALACAKDRELVARTAMCSWSLADQSASHRK